MNFRNISAWSIRNPVIPIVIFFGLMLMGIVSFMRMEVQNDPDIDLPFVVVMVAQPGAAPTEIEKQVTQKIEAAIRSVNGVASISSTASESSSQTMVEFQIGHDLNAAVSEVKNAVDQVRGELPDGILEPQVMKVENSSDPIAYFAVSADDMTIEQLSWFIDDTIAKRLLGVDGMAEVARQGGVNREILVTLDPARMQAMGVTASQVNGALRQLNVNAAGGKAEIGGSRQSVRVLGNARTAFELSQTEIPLGAGRAVKLADVATVRDSFGEITSLAKVNLKPVVTFSIARGRGRSDVSVYDQAIEEIAKIEKETPGIHFTRLFTSVDYTKEQYESSIASMVEGAILAVIVVFFFLRDWRATIIAAIAIPLSAIPTFWFLQAWFGFTLNTLSLLALGLVAGVLVDDAIVEIENIVRHMRMGKTAYQAAIDAADEIGLAVVATTFSIVAVFLPVGVMPGISGQFFKNFGLTVVVSVLMSLAVARMITPLLSAYFLKAHGHEEHAGGPWMERYLRILHWSLETDKAQAIRATLTPAPARWWHRVIQFLFYVLILAIGAAAAAAVSKGMAAIEAPDFITYSLAAIAMVIAFLLAARLTRLIGRMIGGGFAEWHRYFSGRMRARMRGDHRMWMIGAAAGSLALTVIMFMSLPGEFFPSGDRDFTSIKIEMVPGTTLRQTEEVADRVARILQKQQEVSAALERVREGSGSLYVSLRDDRVRSSQDFERDLTPQLQAIEDARVTFQDPFSGGGGGGTGRPIQVMLSGSDPELLEKTAATLVEQMKGVKEVVAPRVSGDMRRPEVVITPRLDLAANLGVTTASLSQAIRIATIGDIDQNAAKFSLSDRQVPIRVRMPESARRDMSNIANLPVPTASGGTVPLSRVADISLGSGPISIQRYNQQRRIFVGADLAPNVIKSEATEKVNALPILKSLPAGVSKTPFGQDRWQQEMLQSLGMAVPTGIMLVFAVLVLLYHRFISPLVNMGSLFLAPLGGLLALALFNKPLSMTVFIGILMLFGIVAKNSILLIDFAIEEMQRGVAKFDAIIEAGHKRAQPIVMTTVAMTAGMIPTAISLSGDGAWRQPMGIVVIGGLVLSTFLTLLIVPAAFSLADGLEKRVGPKLRRKLLTYEPEHGAEDPVERALPAQ